MTKQGRETPNIPCDVFLAEDEWKAFCAYVKKEPPPDKPSPLREPVRMIASPGGFLGRKGDGEPGTTTMWRGLQRLPVRLPAALCLAQAGVRTQTGLQDIVTGFALFKSLSNARASP